MKKIMPLAASIALILIAGIFASAGTIAQFSDVETSGEDIFQGGTLDLKVGGKDDPYVKVVHIEISEGVGGIYPGWYSEFPWSLKNTGSLRGKLSIEITDIVNKENGYTEPEYNPDTGVLAPGEDGTDTGELGAQKLLQRGYIQLWEPVHSTKEMHLSTADGFYAHDCILNEFGGRTYCNCDYPATPMVLQPGEVVMFYLRLYLLPGVGNCVQGDSVEFDIIFHLEQA